MARKLFQDIVKIDKTTPVVSKKIWREDLPATVPPRSAPVSKRKPEQVEPREVAPREGYRFRLWVVAVFSILFLLFSFSYAFSGVQIKLMPRVENVNIKQDMYAVKDAPVGTLSFDVVGISGEERKTLTAGVEKDVSIAAEGTVVLYNNFSPAQQILLIDTRLEGSNGKMYKTKKRVVVPGMKGDTPGSVEVGVYANEPGEEYNSDPLDFQIFGFKGTPKYSKFYARSKGSITGGFVGKLPEVSEEEKTKAVSELKSSLRDKLVQKAKDQTPDNFILFNDAGLLSIESENFKPAATGMGLEVSIKGTLYGILFEEKALTREVIKKYFAGEENNDVYLQNIENLKFAAPNGLTSDSRAISFNLSGSTQVVWRVDEAKLLESILGIKKKDFNQILSGFPNIASASLSLRPFWKRSLPEDSEDVKILISYPD